MKKRFLASMSVIICLLCSTLLLTGCKREMYIYADGETYAVGDVVLTQNMVSKLDVNWACGAVNIEVDPGVKTIEVYETCEKKLDEEEKLRYCIDSQNTLKIRYRESSTKKVKLNKVKILTIKLPTSYSIVNSITVNNKSAGVKIEELNLSSITITTENGAVVLGGGVVSDVNVTTVSGNIKIIGDAILSNIKVKTTSGEVNTSKITCQNFVLNSISGPSRLNFSNLVTAYLDSTSGAIEVQLPYSVSGFTSSFVTKSGKFSTDFSAVKNDEGKYQFGNGSITLTATTGSANYTIKGV